MPIDVPISLSEGRDEINFADILKTSLACGILVVDDRQRITVLNPEAERVTRVKAASALNHASDLLPAPLRSLIQETMATGNSIHDRHIIVHPEDRGGIMLQVNVAPAGSGKNPGAVVILNDISSARMWESNMRRLDRLHSVGTLSASMAHEIKNAFVAIRTFVDLLLEKNQEADLAEIVRLEMNRIDSIIAQMLKFSGPAKPAFAPMQLHFVLDKSLRLIQHLLEDKRIKVTRSFAAAPDSLHGDQDQLEQAFLNLLFNALDAMGQNGQLRVATEIAPAGARPDGGAREKEGPSLRVTIQDNGVGIPAKNIDRLFEPFFTTKPDGTGLGLAITRRIIQDHGGTITVQSELNRGTTFTLELPVNHANA